MTTKRIAYSTSDGIEVLIPSPGARRENEAEADWLARIQAKDLPPDAADIVVCDVSDIPSDRAFREAWRRQGLGVGIDMAKARAIHMGRIRAARDERLKALDVETVKAVGRGDEAERARVEAQKQKLRDIPQAFDLEKAETPEALKEMWPEELLR